MDILIIKLGAMGDVINTFPLVVNLKTKLGAHIHWVVGPLSSPVVKDHPYVDKAIVFDKLKWKISLPDVVKQIRKQTFDITLDLQRILKSGILTMSAKTKRRIGFDKKRCKEMTWMLPFERIPASNPHSHMLNQYLEFANYLGVSSNNIRWEIPVSGTIPFDLPEKYIVLNIGATKPANRWTEKGFAALAHTLKEKFHITSVLTGGHEDTGMANRIAATSDREVINLAGKTSVIELKEVLAGSKAVVSCDTGPMHMAVALGKDVVALFGPADPRRTGPFSGPVIQKDLPCVP
ncbi:MAG: glycosyltransferase family 9 protein, partial [Deltaproteobacteria bacterium]|nr:glycosyltransferase family 9 protein [Deltaproteobacteria bacterium]